MDKTTLNTQEKALYIRTVLENLYPETPIPLQHSDAYTLLIAVLLSAQCTDARVNTVTPTLFAKANTPQAMILLTPAEIENIIRPCGLAPKKSKAIWDLSQTLLQKYGGQVPATFEDLESLSGVGHKTASVVMSQAFGFAAFPVDTHIHRLATRWGLSSGKNVEQTEADLKALFAESYWNKLHLQLIFYGREHCPARGHKVANCQICKTFGLAD
jgi:endonuclease III